MPAIRRIYGYMPSSSPAIFCDRLYPRGIRKETFAAVQWLKDIAPSPNCAAGITPRRKSVSPNSPPATPKSCKAAAPMPRCWR